MPPVAQLLVLYHLETKTIDGLTASEIAELTGLAYPTINVALRWLVANGIIALTGGKQKHVQITTSKEELWKKTLPLMTSPIERILFTDKKPEGSLMTGETAMGHYTMLAEPATPVIAIDRAIACLPILPQTAGRGSISILPLLCCHILCSSWRHSFLQSLCLSQRWESQAPRAWCNIP